MTKNIIRSLDKGLILRHFTSEDEESLITFNKEIHGEGEWDTRGLVDWTHDLISGKSPVFKPVDFTIVEDTRSGEIVSSCCLISQTWAYEGIPFKVGRPELVGTKKEYRRQGLVRQQFDVLHAWSAQRGELVQAITGIPYYYRQFGYEMTLNLDGGRYGYKIHVPALKEDEKETYRFRPPVEDDIPFIMAAYEDGCQRSMISAVWDEALWRYELFGKLKYNINRRDIFVIENLEGIKVGLIGTPSIKWGKLSTLTIFEIAPGNSWSDISPSVIRFLWQKGKELAKEQGQTQEMFGFWLGECHPAYDAISTLLPRIRMPYAYYMRVPDLAAFLRIITPALEQRLENSAFASYTGTLTLSFYLDGLNLDFKNGELQEIKPLSFDEISQFNASFPPLVFLHLVFGYRSMADLKYAYADCATKDDETANLLNALFPKKVSDIWVIS